MKNIKKRCLCGIMGALLLTVSVDAELPKNVYAQENDKIGYDTEDDWIDGVDEYEDTLDKVRWGEKEHRNQIADILKLSDRSPLSSTEVELMVEACILADDKNMIAMKDNGHVMKGHKNYIKFEKYLFELAISYLKNQTKVKDDVYIANYLRGCDYLSDSERQMLENLNRGIVDLLETKIIEKGDEKYEKSNRKKAIKVMGLACHLAGDIYAHRTYVPNTHEFGNVSGAVPLNAEEYGVLNEIIQNYDVMFASLDNLDTAQPLSKQDGKEVLLASIYGKDSLSSLSAKLESRLYEDNKNFYKFRWKASQKLNTALLSDFRQALKNREDGEPITVVFEKQKMDNYKDLPYRLHRFKQYYAQLP